MAWRKLCHNAAGVLPALLLQPAGILRSDAIGDVALDLVRECVAVGRAMGATLSDTVPEEVLAAYRRSAPDSVNSLHADRLAGRPMEIDARNGVIVRMERHPDAGQQHGCCGLQAMQRIGGHLRGDARHAPWPTILWCSSRGISRLKNASWRGTRHACALATPGVGRVIP